MAEPNRARPNANFDPCRMWVIAAEAEPETPGCPPVATFRKDVEKNEERELAVPAGAGTW